jgi:coenzyme F420-0:L-glutamate ligase/coenzyme F420-1:gamma-L-glutamate ligase
MNNGQLHPSCIDVLLNRRSIRRYTSEPIPDEVLEALLTAAMWAPSAHNRQPWRFVVVRDAQVKDKLARVMGERLRRDLEADSVNPAQIDQDVSRSYARISTAPVAIVLCLSLVEMDSYPDQRRSQNEYVMAVQSVAMAGQNLLLAAHERGLGACWMCAPLFCPDEVRGVLDLPDDWEPQALVTVGYPAESRRKTRRPLAEVILWR